MVVLVLTFITFVVGMTFAAYTWIFKQKEGTSSVYTGTLKVTYYSGNVIDVNLLWPIEKPSIDDTDKIYRNDFEVSNTGTLDAIMRVEIVPEQNEFANDILNYVLYDSEKNEISTGVINGINNIDIVSNVVLESEKTEKYTLIIWLQESNENQNSEMKKNFLASISVDADQKIG